MWGRYVPARIVAFSPHHLQRVTIQLQSLHSQPAIPSLRCKKQNAEAFGKCSAICYFLWLIWQLSFGVGGCQRSNPSTSAHVFFHRLSRFLQRGHQFLWQTGNFLIQSTLLGWIVIHHVINGNGEMGIRPYYWGDFEAISARKLKTSQWSQHYNACHNHR